MKLRKLLKRIKKRLVKKVTLYESTNHSDFLEFKLKLGNFWGLKRKVTIEFTNSENTQTLPFKRNKSVLVARVPKNFLYTTDSKATIKIYINNNLMWIKPSENFEYNSESIIAGKKYFGIMVKKNIILRSQFPEFEFSKERLLSDNITTDYNSLQFRLEHPPLVNDNKKIEIHAFQNSKVRVIEGFFNNNIVEAYDFSILSIGLWQLFLVVDGVLHPISNKNEQKEAFNTYNHKVEIVNKYNNLYLNLKPHKLDSSSINIDRFSNDQVTVQIQPTNINENLEYELVMNDTKSNEEFFYSLMKDSQGLVAKVPLKDIYEVLSNKRFFVVQSGEKSFKYQINLNGASIAGDSTSFEETIRSQIVSLSFYKRKDFSLGIKVSEPRLKKMITKIDKFNVSGTLGSTLNFINCDAYLYIEERNSQEAIKVPIEGSFNIDLNSLNLIKLKSKDKTIFDFYVVVLNKEKEIIRKEKIKYKFSNYKKDNYYDYMSIEDNDLNKHHFLITTTPFNNLKIETFSIPSNIVVPKDTSVKDGNIWLLGERYNTAQDNGIVLFNWLQENTNVESYYVIEGDSPEYEKLKDNPNVLEFGSQKHYDIAFKAKVLLGTHDLENILPYKPAKGFFHYENTYKVFLQHGVLGRKNVEYHKKYYELPFDLFIVSSDPEKYEVVMEKLGYDKDEVVVTGLARFDNLDQFEKPKNILLMPTWRDWINTDQHFLDSEYYTAYSNLINNERLLNLLDEYNVNLNFYPHYRAQDYFQKESSTLNNRIKFIPLGKYSVQELLINHALLITDFSSVSFDFLLLNKPVIYYHFDVKRFFRKGILRPVEETFIGRVANTEEGMIDLIEDRLKHNFDNYDVDISNIIKYQDRSNSERIYKAVRSNIQE
ncbi:CDP-glycerol glycerophosphotransferase family protein [Virgibacillus byunsanensis]|uniref:CDP-glycerol glycerophosphotransferase family protein n=1 Tax=Virgibacillus byunsanensis TaxID=570945 RepID=A0ABW3LIN6_9BACI